MIGLTIVLAAFNIITLLILLESPNVFPKINQHIQTESKKPIDTSVHIKAIEDRVSLLRGWISFGSYIDRTWYMESNVDKLGKFCEATCSITFLNFSGSKSISLPVQASGDLLGKPVAGVWTTTEGIYNLSVTFDDISDDACYSMKFTLDYNYIGDIYDSEQHITLNGRIIYPLSDEVSHFIQQIEWDK